MKIIFTSLIQISYLYENNLYGSRQMQKLNIDFCPSFEVTIDEIFDEIFPIASNKVRGKNKSSHNLFPIRPK